MIEKLIVLEDIDPVIFYGVNNANIQLIKALYPKLRIVARGNVIKVLGDEEEMCAFEENITKLEKYCAEYNSLKETEYIMSSPATMEAIRQGEEDIKNGKGIEVDLDEL